MHFTWTCQSSACVAQSSYCRKHCFTCLSSCFAFHFLLSSLIAKVCLGVLCSPLARVSQPCGDNMLQTLSGHLQPHRAGRMKAVCVRCHGGSPEVTSLPVLLELSFLCTKSFDQNMVIIVLWWKCLFQKLLQTPKWFPLSGLQSLSVLPRSCWIFSIAWF